MKISGYENFVVLQFQRNFHAKERSREKSVSSRVLEKGFGKSLVVIKLYTLIQL